MVLYIYAYNTGTPMSRRGGGVFIPSGQKWLWLGGVERLDGTKETREEEQSGTWYEMRSWAERESLQPGNLYAWVRRATGREDQVKIWTWRKGFVISRRKLYLWEVEADPYLSERERAAIEEKARESHESFEKDA